MDWYCRICKSFYTFAWWHKRWRKHEPDGTYP